MLLGKLEDRKQVVKLCAEGDKIIENLRDSWKYLSDFTSCINSGVPKLIHCVYFSGAHKITENVT